MSKHHDRVFYDTFMLILGALVLFALAILFLSRAIAANTVDQYRAEDTFYQQVKAERLEPVGSVAVAGSGDTGAAAGSPAPADGGQATAAAEVDGSKTYNQACVSCHGSGIAGAPKTGDTAAWEPRIAKGMDTMYENAIKGFQGETGVMPPKGGFMSLSDEQVRAAVDYMVEESS